MITVSAHQAEGFALASKALLSEEYKKTETTLQLYSQSFSDS